MSWKERFRHLIGVKPERVKIGQVYVGTGEPVFVIAEAGINHNGDIELAKKLVDVAVEAGANAIKFQKRTTSEILTKEGLDKPYNSPNAFAPTYGEHREKLEFGVNQYQILKSYAQEKGILFFASAWDPVSADLLEELGVDAYKIPSADTINLDLLEHIAKKGKPVMLSTGMNTESEIDAAVETVLTHNNRVIIFHCVSLYPCPDDKIDLRFMDVLREKYAPLPVGYSGHETTLDPTLTAVARGAVIVERHLTLDKTMRGSDHAASLDPKEFTELVLRIRNIEKILGRKEKVIVDELKPLREKLAKSLVTRCVVRKGTVITAEMLGVKGPGIGIEPYRKHDVIGRVAQQDFDADVLLPKDALHWPTF